MNTEGTNHLFSLYFPRERDENYITIPVQIKNKKSIFEGLDEFIAGELLEGDNEFMCETCNKKYPTLKRIVLKTLPNHLIICLKRFEFNY